MYPNFIVAESAVSSISKVKFLDRILLFSFQNPTLQTLNCMVLVARAILPFLLTFFRGVVYSPLHRRKYNATTARSPAACWHALLVRYANLCAASDHLWNCWWVQSFKALHYSFDGKTVFSLFFEDETLFSNQLVGLGDGRERVRDCLDANLISVSISPGLYPGGKTGKDDSLLTSSLFWPEGIKVEDLTVVGPVFPIFFPSLNSL